MNALQTGGAQVRTEYFHPLTTRQVTFGTTGTDSFSILGTGKLVGFDHPADLRELGIGIPEVPLDYSPHGASRTFWPFDIIGSAIELA